MLTDVFSGVFSSALARLAGDLFSSSVSRLARGLLFSAPYPKFPENRRRNHQITHSLLGRQVLNLCPILCHIMGALDELSNPNGEEYRVSLLSFRSHISFPLGDPKQITFALRSSIHLLVFPGDLRWIAWLRRTYRPHHLEDLCHPSQHLSEKR